MFSSQVKFSADRQTDGQTDRYRYNNIDVEALKKVFQQIEKSLLHIPAESYQQCRKR